MVVNHNMASICESRQLRYNVKKCGDACGLQEQLCRSEEPEDQGGNLSADQRDHQTVCREEPCACL